MLIPIPLASPRSPSSLVRVINPDIAFEYAYRFSGGRVESLVILTSIISDGLHVRGYL